MNKYPELQEEVKTAVSEKLQEGAEEAKKQLSLFIDLQLSYINTNQADFIGYTKWADFWIQECNALLVTNRI